MFIHQTVYFLLFQLVKYHLSDWKMDVLATQDLLSIKTTQCPAEFVNLRFLCPKKRSLALSPCTFVGLI
jgi:hypothetical protein